MRTYSQGIYRVGKKLHQFNTDFNGQDQEGVGYYQVIKKMEKDAALKLILNP